MFEEITDIDTVRDVFTVTFKQGAPVTLWLKDKSLQFEVKLAAVNKEKIFIDLPKEISTEQWDETLRTQGTQNNFTMYGQVYIHKTYFYLKLIVEGRIDRTIKFIHPSSVFKLQRRSAHRIRFAKGNSPQVQFSESSGLGEKKSYRMLDLSVGGLAFAIKHEEKDSFSSGQSIKALKFQIMYQTILADGLVKHLQDSKDEAGLPIVKVGLEFKNLLPEYDKLISQFILNESRRIFSTL